MNPLVVKYLYLPIAALFSFFLFSCSSPKKESLPVIDVFSAHQHPQKVPVSAFGSEVEYVLLETRPDCQIGDWTRYYLDKEIIIVIGFRQIFIFNRTDGKFIKQIGHWGKDPHGYRNTVFSDEYDYEMKMVKTAGWQLYSNIFYPLGPGEEITRENPREVYNITKLSNGNLIGYIKNYEGTARYRLKEFSETDTTAIHCVPNHNFFMNNGSAATFGDQGGFYHFSGETYFYELFTDTIFRYDNGELEAHMILNLGKFGQTYDKQVDRQFLTNRAGFILPEKIFETKHHVFLKYYFNSSYVHCLYDKRSRETKATMLEQSIPGFTNDLDGFINFPLSTISPDGYAIGAVQAVDIIHWMDSAKRSAPENIRNINNLNMYSNPLVMIVKLKN